MGDFEKATKLFTDTATNGQPDLVQKSYYNLGNVAYRQGKLPEAVSYYEKAIDIDAKDADAKYNLEFVRKEIKRRLEEQKKRQQQQGQNTQDQKDQKQQDQQKQDQNNRPDREAR